MQETDKDELIVQSRNGMMFARLKYEQHVWPQHRFNTVSIHEYSLSPQDYSIKGGAGCVMLTYHLARLQGKQDHPSILIDI